MLQVRKQTVELAIAPGPELNSELIFPGGKFELEKRPFPLILSVNYAILGLVLICSFPLTLESIGWTAVLFSLSGAMMSRLRGRWLALMTFSVPILLTFLQTGFGRLDLMELWVICLISISAAYSSFNVVSGFARWLKGRQKANA